MTAGGCNRRFAVAEPAGIYRAIAVAGYIVKIVGGFGTVIGTPQPRSAAVKPRQECIGQAAGRCTAIIELGQVAVCAGDVIGAAGTAREVGIAGHVAGYRYIIFFFAASEISAPAAYAGTVKFGKESIAVKIAIGTHSTLVRTGRSNINGVFHGPASHINVIERIAGYSRGFGSCCTVIGAPFIVAGAVEAGQEANIPKVKAKHDGTQVSGLVCAGTGNVEEAGCAAAHIYIAARIAGHAIAIFGIDASEISAPEPCTGITELYEKGILYTREGGAVSARGGDARSAVGITGKIDIAAGSQVTDWPRSSLVPP